MALFFGKNIKWSTDTGLTSAAQNVTTEAQALFAMWLNGLAGPAASSMVTTSAGWLIQGSGTGTGGTSTGGNVFLTAGGGAFPFLDRAWWAHQIISIGWAITYQWFAAGGWRIKIAFSGNTGSLGSFNANTTPTLVNENIIFGGGTDASPTSGGSLFQTIDTSQFWHVIGDSTTRAFMLFSYAGGGGLPNATNVRALHFLDVPTSGEITGPTNNVVQTSTPANGGQKITGGWNVGGFGASVWEPTSIEPLLWRTTVPNTIPTAGSTDTYSFKDNLLPLIWWHSSSGLPSGNVNALKGVSAWLQWKGQTGRNNADTYTTAGARDRIVLGDITIPWDGTQPPQ